MLLLKINFLSILFFSFSSNTNFIIRVRLRRKHANKQKIMEKKNTIHTYTKTNSEHFLLPGFLTERDHLRRDKHTIEILSILFSRFVSLCSNKHEILYRIYRIFYLFAMFLVCFCFCVQVQERNINQHHDAEKTASFVVFTIREDCLLVLPANMPHPNDSFEEVRLGIRLIVLHSNFFFAMSYASHEMFDVRQRHMTTKRF